MMIMASPSGWKKDASMWVYTVKLTNSVDVQDLITIRDDRDPGDIAKDLVKKGYLVSEAVKVRWAVTGYTTEDGVTYNQHYFSADPQGQTILFAPFVAQITEWVVPPDAEPMPD
ncbi:hypothetical protein FHS85_000885 [Rhodoligotrophos appendicifer]|uniref:hypothetical protein n=1 Tax=Rhodoligotrophos appendicifer TaxID=987056 RepID=UPI00117D44B8|nr:hypothetical protein [Rhodoligotrophos appendicifer]